MVSTAVLSELILIAHQANWGDSDGSFFNICWLIDIVDELETTVSQKPLYYTTYLAYIIHAILTKNLKSKECDVLLICVYN